MQDTAGTWLMTALTSSPLLIALMQTAASLPVLLLGFLAGATADIYDRRRLLMFWQAWMLVAVVILSVLTLFGVISPWTLLALTFLLNIGAAMTNPAWQAIVPELVPRSELADAIAMNSAGYNLARAVGPALGGLAVAAFASTSKGAGTVFFVNAVSFVAVIWVLYVWRRTPLFKSALPAERIAGLHESRPPLRTLCSRASGGACARIFLYRVRKRDLGAVGGGSAAGPPSRRDGLRRSERLPGSGRGCRRRFSPQPSTEIFREIPLPSRPAVSALSRSSFLPSLETFPPLSSLCSPVVSLGQVLHHHSMFQSNCPFRLGCRRAR